MYILDLLSFFVDFSSGSSHGWQDCHPIYV